MWERLKPRNLPFTAERPGLKPGPLGKLFPGAIPQHLANGLREISR